MRLAKSATDWPSLPMTEENEENHGKPVFDPIRWSLARMLKMNTKCQWQYGCMHDPSRNLTPYKATILWSPKGTISWSLMGLGCCIMQWSPPGVPGTEIGSKLWFFSDDDVIECDHWGWAGHSVDQAWLGRYLQCIFIHFPIYSCELERWRWGMTLHVISVPFLGLSWFHRFILSLDTKTKPTDKTVSCRWALDSFQLEPMMVVDVRKF